MATNLVFEFHAVLTDVPTPIPVLIRAGNADEFGEIMLELLGRNEHFGSDWTLEKIIQIEG